jgi:hypothetical protein
MPEVNSISDITCTDITAITTSACIIKETTSMTAPNPAVAQKPQTRFSGIGSPISDISGYIVIGFCPVPYYDIGVIIVYQTALMFFFHPVIID